MVTREHSWVPHRKRGTCSACGRPGLALMRGGLIWPHCPMRNRGRFGKYGKSVIIDSMRWCEGGGLKSKEGIMT